MTPMTRIWMNEIIKEGNAPPKAMIKLDSYEGFKKMARGSCPRGSKIR
jgi:hypothetical protein